MERSRSLLIAFVLVVGMVAFLSSFGIREHAVIERELALAFTLRVVGSLVAVIGLVGVLGQWYSGAGTSRLASGGVVILAGALVASQTWAVALAFGAAVGVAAISGRVRQPEASSGTAPDAMK